MCIFLIYHAAPCGGFEILNIISIFSTISCTHRLLVHHQMSSKAHPWWMQQITSMWTNSTFNTRSTPMYLLLETAVMLLLLRLLLLLVGCDSRL